MISVTFYNNWKHKAIHLFSTTLHIGWKKQLVFWFELEILGLNFWFITARKEKDY